MSNPLRVYQALYGDCFRLAREYASVSSVTQATPYYQDIKIVCSPTSGKLYDLADNAHKSAFYAAAEYVNSQGYSYDSIYGYGFLNGADWSSWAHDEINKLDMLFKVFGYTFTVGIIYT